MTLERPTPPDLTWHAPEQLPVTVEAPALVTSFGGGMVIAAMKSLEDGTWQLTWSVSVAANRTLPEVELFIAKAATYILEEPIQTWDEYLASLED